MNFQNRKVNPKRPHHQAESMSDLQVKRMARLEKNFERLENELEEFETMVQKKLPALGIELEKTGKPAKNSNRNQNASEKMRRTKPR